MEKCSYKGGGGGGGGGGFGLRRRALWFWVGLLMVSIIMHNLYNNYW